MAQGGPAFSAYQSSAQSVTAATYTKVNLQTEEFDTDNCFDNATNYRFQPTVAGYYQFDASVSSATTNQVMPVLYKNGVASKYGATTPTASSIGNIGSVSGLIYLNGSSDYVELYVYLASTSNLTAGLYTGLQGFLARPA